LSGEVRQRLPRIVLDFVAILVTLLVAYIVLPIVSVIGVNVPVAGISAGLAVAVVFAVILAILVVRVLRDAAAITHLSSHMFSQAVPGLEETHQNLIRKVIRDFLYVVVIIILFYILTPFVVLIPGIGISLAAAIPLILLAVVIILLYDAARLIYDEVAKGVHAVTEKVASAVEESEKKSKK
jgi:hypothetical protein